jgi:hypothetical protein
MARLSLKGQVAELRRDMRAAGRTWREIARVIEDRYRVTPIAAFRLAHGWSQTELADRYNKAYEGTHLARGHVLGDRGARGRVCRKPPGAPVRVAPGRAER